MNLRTCSARASLSILTFASGLLLAQAIPAQTASTASVSKVRIVRLSEVKGAVQLDRSNGRGLEPAIANLPIVERNQLQTGTGVAEVEFEDNSSLRLAPDSKLEFPELSRTAAGTTVSSVRLIKGMAYITMVKSKGNEFNLLFGDHSVAVPAGTHLRIDANDNGARLAVLDGALKLDTPHGPLEVTKKKTITLLPDGDIDPAVAKYVDSNPLDSWDKQSTDYHARMAAMSAFGNSPYSYGVSDMLYYGAFSDAGGCGSMWRPYFTSASWEPYSAGAWAWSGAAYTWVSPYPWGWMPYYSGSWNYCPGAGWGWQPGAWTGLNNGTLIALNPSNGGKTHLPVAPPHPPAPGSPAMVPVISKPLVRSELGSRNSFLFRNDSAGFGVPRGELGQLNKFSAQAVSKGATRTTVYLSVEGPHGASGGIEPRGVTAANAGIGTVSVHRGSPPPRESESSISSSGSSSFGGGSSSSSLSSSSSPSASGSSGGGRGSPAPAPGGGGGRPR